MGNAQPSVKSAADWVTRSCDEDGVAYAIEKLLEGSIAAGQR
jgi:hydroxymethylpyrimidine pyrophosphatase-like HAD family hydrolase